MAKELKKGDIIYANRLGGLYRHYGVFVGDDTVIHYSGQPENFTEAQIEKIELTDFMGDAKKVKKDNCKPRYYSRDEIVERAYSKLNTGKNEYDIVSNNCEHFVRWCQTNEKTSKQVDQTAKVAAGGILCLAGIAVIGGLVSILKDEL